jgi:hypothetical protein
MAPSPESRAIAYAETRLKVHEVYLESCKALRLAEEGRALVTTLSHNKRVLQDAMTDVEMQLVSTERAAFPDMSQAAFDRHIKAVVHGDPDMTTLRLKLLEDQHQLDQADDSLHQAELTVRVLTARMEELSGLLNFYAATKQVRATDVEGK